MDTDYCSCCSGKSYEACCKVFHEGALPDTALQLMRSRYAAYALDLPDYIIETTHPENPHYSEDRATWKEGISRFSRRFSFNQLEIHDFQEKYVTFTAHISEGERDATFTEKSRFEKVHHKWLYHSCELL